MSLWTSLRRRLLSRLLSRWRDMERQARFEEYARVRAETERLRREQRLTAARAEALRRAVATISREGMAA